MKNNYFTLSQMTIDKRPIHDECKRTKPMFLTGMFHNLKHLLYVYFTGNERWVILRKSILSGYMMRYNMTF